MARAADLGFKEIALTGVHLGSYGRDLRPPSSLLGLLRLLDGHPAAPRFRISSLEPADCTPEIVDLVAGSARFAPHFHLPLQHASDDVLRSMRRPYRLADYRSIVESIHRRLPDAAIGSDVIVGFPGETDEDARTTLTYLERSPLNYLHVFPYSDRPGTSAAGLSAKVPPAVIRARAVREVGAGLTRRFRTSQVGAIRRGVTLSSGSEVVTDNYLKVDISPARPRNAWVTVRITAAGDTVRGDVVDAPVT